MSSVELGVKVRNFKDRKKQIRAEYLKKANEALREEYLDICRTAWDIVRNQGVKIATIASDAGVARTTVYNWLDDYAELRTVTSDAPKQAPIKAGWEVTLVGDGMITANSPDGSRWELSDSGEAWNKDANQSLYSFTEWPDRAKDTLDKALAKE